MTGVPNEMKGMANLPGVSSRSVQGGENATRRSRRQTEKKTERQAAKVAKVKTPRKNELLGVCFWATLAAWRSFHSALEQHRVAFLSLPGSLVTPEMNFNLNHHWHFRIPASLQTCTQVIAASKAR